jgi:hypothetical protein
MSNHDHSDPYDPLSTWDSPYTPGTPMGDSLRWYEVRKSEPLIERAHTPYTGKLPVVRIAATFILGVWGAIILGFFL